MSIKPTMTYFTPIGTTTAIIKFQKITDDGEDVEGLGPCALGPCALLA